MLETLNHSPQWKKSFERKLIDLKLVGLIPLMTECCYQFYE